MKITQSQETTLDFSYSKESIDIDEKFKDILNEKTQQEKSVEDITKEVNADIQQKELDRKSQVQQFLDDLTSKGSSQFLSDLNKEKIEEKVQEYKDKLIEQMGDSPESMELIQDMVADFRKQLMEELQASIDSDDNKVGLGSIEAMTNTLFNMKDDTKKPLEQLLSS